MQVQNAGQSITANLQSAQDGNMLTLLSFSFCSPIKETRGIELGSKPHLCFFTFTVMNS